MASQEGQDQQSKPEPSAVWSTLPTWDDVNMDLLFSQLSNDVRQYALTTPGFSVIEEVLAERFVTLYVTMRAKEKKALEDKKTPEDAYAHDRSWKEVNQQLASMAATIQKSVASMSNPETIRKHLEASMVEAVDVALSEVDPAVAQVVRLKLIDALSASV